MSLFVFWISFLTLHDLNVTRWHDWMICIKGRTSTYIDSTLCWWHYHAFMKFFFQSQLTLFAAFSVICFEIAVPIFAMPLTAVSAAEMIFVLFFFIFEVVIFFVWVLIWMLCRWFDVFKSKCCISWCKRYCGNDDSIFWWWICFGGSERSLWLKLVKIFFLCADAAMFDVAVDDEDGITVWSIDCCV